MADNIINIQKGYKTLKEQQTKTEQEVEKENVTSVNMNTGQSEGKEMTSDEKIVLLTKAVADLHNKIYEE